MTAARSPPTMSSGRPTTLKEKGHPDLRLQLQDLTSVEAPDPRTVVMRFSETASLELPLSVASTADLLEAFFADRDFEASTMAPVLGSGPTRSAISPPVVSSNTSGCPTIGRTTCRSAVASTIST